MPKSQEKFMINQYVFKNVQLRYRKENIIYFGWILSADRSSVFVFKTTYVDVLKLWILIQCKILAKN